MLSMLCYAKHPLNRWRSPQHRFTFQQLHLPNFRSSLCSLCFLSSQHHTDTVLGPASPAWPCPTPSTTTVFIYSQHSWIYSIFLSLSLSLAHPTTGGRWPPALSLVLLLASQSAHTVCGICCTFFGSYILNEEFCSDKNWHFKLFYSEKLPHSVCAWVNTFSLLNPF